MNLLLAICKTKTLAAIVLMVSLSILALVISKSHGVVNPHVIPGRYRISGDAMANFASLSSAHAVRLGRKMATKDFSRRLFRVFTYGEPRLLVSPSEMFLRETYAIYTVPIAGCVVSEGTAGVADGYNTRMKKLLFGHFKKDIFAEASGMTPQRDSRIVQ